MLCDPRLPLDNTNLDEVLRLLPYSPQDRFLELAPRRWAATRAKLEPAQLDTPLTEFTIPAV